MVSISRRELAVAGVLAAAVGAANHFGLLRFNRVDYLEYSPSSSDPETIMEDFARFMRAESQDRFVLLDFHGDWCPYCHILTPKLVPGAERSGEDVLIVKLRVQDLYRNDTNLGILQTLKVTGSWPEIQIWKNMKFVDHTTGSMPASDVADFIRRAADKWRKPPTLERPARQIHASRQAPALQRA